MKGPKNIIMNEKTIVKLEFDKIRNMVVKRCVSDGGAKIAAGMMPSKKSIYIEKWLNETTEAAGYILRRGASPMRGFSDTRPAVQMANIGSMLLPGSLLAISDVLMVSRTLKNRIMDFCEKTSYLYQYGDSLPSIRGLEEEIKHCIISEDEIADNASPELSRIRRQMKIFQDRIREKLNDIIRNSGNHLQDSIITIRGGRFVVPVIAEHKNSVKGVVHDQSGSGATLFIEPMAVVEINNSLNEYKGREKEEIDRILAELTAMVAEQSDEIIFGIKTLIQLDFMFAKGRLSVEMRGICPRISDKRYVYLKNARHPLIPHEEIVPVTIKLGQDYTSLIITGPNTGGKTVTLKTCGLLAIMAQAGLHIPADDGSILPVFSKIFADIGDEQSIAQSLSTFSSHMTNIVSILENVDYASLVLLDELGAGTDPTEGAALGIAILERLQQVGARTMATTHYSELKAYALTQSMVENASMEFDVNTLSPTFRLMLGIPGKSNAFEISSKLGLSDEVINRSRELLSEEAIRFEDVMQNAEYHRKLAEKEKKLAQEARMEMELNRRLADKQRESLEKQTEKIMENARSQARRIINKAKLDADRAIKELKNAKTSDGNRDRAIQDSKDILRKAENEYYDKTVVKKQRAKGLVPKNLIPGDPVHCVDIDKDGTVLIKPNEKGDLQVQIGLLKLKTNIKNLRRVKIVQNSTVRRIVKKQMDLRIHISMELDIRGYDGFTGVSAMEKHLDECSLAGLGEAQIIHGKGTGALRASIHKALKSNPQVKSFRLGKYGEGETGVTIVKLK